MRKTQILEELNSRFDKKIRLLHDNLNNLSESQNEETKSSAGDKYETGREMLQMEIDTLEQQITQMQNQKNELSRVSKGRVHEQVEHGSLVHTDNGIYFLAIGLGEIRLDETPIYCISEASPIGQLLSGKKAGDSVSFRDKIIRIQQVG